MSFAALAVVVVGETIASTHWFHRLGDDDDDDDDGDGGDDGDGDGDDDDDDDNMNRLHRLRETSLNVILTTPLLAF